MAEIFEYAVAYVPSLAAFEAVRPAAKAAGVLGLAVKVWDANPDPDVTANLAALEQGASAELRQQGFVVGAWACPRFKPVSCAADVSTLYGERGLSFVVFETESEYKTDGGGIDVSQLLAPWRALRRNAYTAVATEGMVPETFDHAAAIAAGCRYLPESYWRLGERYDARAELQAAVALGWPVGRVHPTLTGVEGHTMAEALVRCYRSRAAGFTRGVGVWRVDELGADDYRLLGLARGDLFR